MTVDLGDICLYTLKFAEDQVVDMLVTRIIQNLWLENYRRNTNDGEWEIITQKTKCGLIEIYGNCTYLEMTFKQRQGYQKNYNIREKINWMSKLCILE